MSKTGVSQKANTNIDARDGTEQQGAEVTEQDSRDYTQFPHSAEWTSAYLCR
jgi:hypothetical protein